MNREFIGNNYDNLLIIPAISRAKMTDMIDKIEIILCCCFRYNIFTKFMQQLVQRLRLFISFNGDCSAQSIRLSLAFH